MSHLKHSPESPCVLNEFHIDAVVLRSQNVGTLCAESLFLLLKEEAQKINLGTKDGLEIEVALREVQLGLHQWNLNISN